MVVVGGAVVSVRRAVVVREDVKLVETGGAAGVFVSLVGCVPDVSAMDGPAGFSVSFSAGFSVPDESAVSEDSGCVAEVLKALSVASLEGASVRTALTAGGSGGEDGMGSWLWHPAAPRRSAAPVETAKTFIFILHSPQSKHTDTTGKVQRIPQSYQKSHISFLSYRPFLHFHKLTYRSSSCPHPRRGLVLHGFWRGLPLPNRAGTHP